MIWLHLLCPGKMIQGDPDAQHSLGLMSYQGHGGAQDLIKARICFEQAANQGHAEAQKMLEVPNAEF